MSDTGDGIPWLLAKPCDTLGASPVMLWPLLNSQAAALLPALPPVLLHVLLPAGPLLHRTVHEASRHSARVGGDVRTGLCCAEHAAAGTLPGSDALYYACRMAHVLT